MLTWIISLNHRRSETVEAVAIEDADDMGLTLRENDFLNFLLVMDYQNVQEVIYIHFEMHCYSMKQSFRQ